MESVEQLRKAQIFDLIHLVNVKQHYLSMVAVNGTCERNKAPLIPYPTASSSSATSPFSS